MVNYPIPRTFMVTAKATGREVWKGKAAGEGQPHMLPLPRTSGQQDEQRHPRELHTSPGGPTPDMVEFPPEV